MDMSKYKEMFLSEAREHLNNMNQLVVSMEKEPHGREIIDSLFRSAHSIKGMAASMGYEEIAELSHVVEDLMDKFRKEAMTVTPEAIDIMLEGVDALERLTNAIEQDIKADIDTSRIAGRIKSFGERKTVVENTAPELVELRPEAMPAQTVTGHRPEAASLNISVEISHESSSPSVRAFLICRKIKELGEIIATDPSESDIRSGRFTGRFSVIVKTDSDWGRIEEAVTGMGEVASLKIVPVEVNSFSAQTGDVRGPDFPRVENLITAPLQQTVKVNINVLDYFVNTIGELIITKSRLHQVSRSLKSKDLKDGLGQLDRLVRDLHDKVMTVRMMPIDSILERFPRLVRDLARKQGKEVGLFLEGQDIELDRSILEGLANPLTHMVRNSIDHGIETPDERNRLGKPLPARILIKASREKDHVFIEVSDDGRGMEPEKLRDSAVKKGLITAEKAHGMIDKEALRLICLPGFSTVSEVSEISGRGVGMDAVNTVAEALGGSIDIDSRPGDGSRITLKLPVTVAIIQSLLVEAGSETYAIPISRVLRTIETERENIKMSQKQRLIDFDGFLIPLLSLRKMLRMPPIQAQTNFIHVIVTEIKGKTVGIVVDRFAGQQEAFIKPLGRPLSRIAGLSGTTVLGNGRTIFLLDIGSLM